MRLKQHLAIIGVILGVVSLTFMKVIGEFDNTKIVALFAGGLHQAILSISCIIVAYKLGAKPFISIAIGIYLGTNIWLHVAEFQELPNFMSIVFALMWSAGFCLYPIVLGFIALLARRVYK
jgi:hypothetical protein